MSSVGSLKDQDAKKKKKKSWVRINALCLVFTLNSLVLVYVQTLLLDNKEKAAWKIKYGQSPLCCVILLFLVFEVSVVIVSQQSLYKFLSHSMNYLKLRRRPHVPSITVY